MASLRVDSDFTCLAFYGVAAESAHVEGAYRAVLNWFASIAVAPTHLTVHGTGLSGKQGSFKKESAKLARLGFRAVSGWTVTAAAPKATLPVLDFVATGFLSVDPGDSYAVVCARSSLVSLTEKSLLPLAAEMIDQLTPQYGIGYERDGQLGPHLYAIGLTQGLGFSEEDLREGDRISAWGHTAMPTEVYRKGLVRDVYRWNFLSAAQLAFPIGKLPLKEWVPKDSKRGTFREVGGPLTLWDVDDRQALAIRGALRGAGAIFTMSGVHGADP